MNPLEEIRRKAENMLRFFAMDARQQITYLGGLPHDHGHPRFAENNQVIRFKTLIDNFLESQLSVIISAEQIEADMQYLLELELQNSPTMAIWSEQGVRKHPLWRILRLLAHETLLRTGVAIVPPTVTIDELSCR